MSGSSKLPSFEVMKNNSMMLRKQLPVQGSSVRFQVRHYYLTCRILPLLFIVFTEWARTKVHNKNNEIRGYPVTKIHHTLFKKCLISQWSLAANQVQQFFAVPGTQDLGTLVPIGMHGVHCQGGKGGERTS